MDLDCGVGGNPVASSQTQSANFPTSTTTYKPPPDLAAAYPAMTTGTDACQEICVDGFAQEDAYLNSHYVRIALPSGGFSHWSGGGYWIKRGLDGRWRFLEVPADMEVATGTLHSQETIVSGVPDSDYFITATGGNQIQFECCDRATQAEVLASQLQKVSNSNSGKVEQGSSSVVVVIIVASVCSAVLLLGAGVLWKYPSILGGLAGFRPRNRPRVYKTMEPDFPDKSGGLENRTVPSGGTTNARFENSNYAEQPRYQEQTKAAQPKYGLSEAKNSGRLGTWRGRTQFVCVDKSDVAGQHRREAGASTYSTTIREDEGAAAAVATMLGRASPNQARGGVYEGPVGPGWGVEKAGATTRDFQVGSEVRLRGLVSQPTWNGTEGLIEGIDATKGHLQVRLPDGRVKAVRPENCEHVGGPQAAGPGGSNSFAGTVGPMASTAPQQMQAAGGRGGSTSYAGSPMSSSTAPQQMQAAGGSRMPSRSTSESQFPAPPPLPPPPAALGPALQKGGAASTARREAPTPARAAPASFRGNGSNAADSSPFSTGSPSRGNGDIGRAARQVPTEGGGGLVDDLQNAQHTVQAQLDNLKTRLSDRPQPRPYKDTLR